MVRTNQGGSILGFVIIGAIMALLLIGGAYFVRNNLTSIASEASGVMEGISDSDESSEEEVANTDDNEADQNKEDENTDQEERGPDAATSDEPSDNGNHSQAAPETTAENLPESGPGEVLATALLLSGIVGIAAAYLRSLTLPSSL